MTSRTGRRRDAVGTRCIGECCTGEMCGLELEGVEMPLGLNHAGHVGRLFEGSRTGRRRDAVGTGPSQGLDVATGSQSRTGRRRDAVGTRRRLGEQSVRVPVSNWKASRCRWDGWVTLPMIPCGWGPNCERCPCAPVSLLSSSPHDRTWTPWVGRFRRVCRRFERSPRSSNDLGSRSGS